MRSLLRFSGLHWKELRHSRISSRSILTGQRRMEVASLRKSWRNTQERIITLPDHITKNHQEHSFPYGPFVDAILVRLSNVVEGDLYFPPYRSHVRGKRTTTYNGWGKDKKEFDQRCGVWKWTLHDLRRAFPTRLAEFGVLPHVVERLLNHRMGAIANKTQGFVTDLAEIYNLATCLPEMRRAIAVWESKLDALLRPSKAA